MCLPLDNVCDGSRDCPNRDDEEFCGIVCPVNCTCTPSVVFCVNQAMMNLASNISENTKKLDISYSHITLDNDTFLRDLPKLVELVLKGNKIGPIILPDTFMNLKNLKTLDLSNNLIEELRKENFFGLINLIKISLEGNPIVLLESGCFAGLTKLPVLQLEHLAVPVIERGTFKGLDQLKELSLTNSSVKFLQPGALNHLEGVEVLDMSNNKIQKSFKGDFYGLSSLKKLVSDDHMYCCYVDLPADSCYPKADEFSSCLDLMKNNTLRAFLWILGMMALLGNGFVLGWRLWNERKKLNVPGFLVMNLAAADFLMGVYMICIAATDVYYRGVYVENAQSWKSSTFCSALGCLSTISSEASVFTLCVITADRLKNIVFPLSGRKITVKEAGYIMGCVWSLAVILGVAPLFPSSYFKGQFYSRSGVCVSLHITSDKNPGWEYSSVIFHGLNLCTFLFIFSSYAYMYRIIQDSCQMALSTSQKKRELTAARRMTLIVLTDFCCWMPINIMGT